MAMNLSEVKISRVKQDAFLNFKSDDRFEPSDNEFMFYIESENRKSIEPDIKLASNAFANEDRCNFLSYLIATKKYDKIHWNHESIHKCISIYPVDKVTEDKLQFHVLVSQDEGNYRTIRSVITVDKLSYEREFLVVRIESVPKAPKSVIAFALIAIKVFYQNADLFFYKAKNDLPRVVVDVVTSRCYKDDSKYLLRQRSKVFLILSKYQRYLSDLEDKKQSPLHLIDSLTEENNKDDSSSRSSSSGDEDESNNFEITKILLMAHGVTSKSIEAIREVINKSNYGMLTKECIEIKYVKSLEDLYDLEEKSEIILNPAKDIHLSIGIIFKLSFKEVYH